MELHDKVALVTGAARRIGREIARALAQAGCRVAVHYRSSRDEAEAVVREIHDAGGAACAVQADLSSPDAPESVVGAVCARLGEPDVLINNAGVFEAGPWGRWAAADFLRQYQVNAVAPALLAQACWPFFRRRGEGKVVNIADVYAGNPLASHASYSASKAALVSLTRSLARLMAPEVQVNAVAPGAALFPEDYSAEQRAAVISRTLLGRAGGARDIARAVLYLLRDGDYVTGQILTVDGGRAVGWAGA
jgi:pteridine reductase